MKNILSWLALLAVALAGTLVFKYFQTQSVVTDDMFDDEQQLEEPVGEVAEAPKVEDSAWVWEYTELASEEMVQAPDDSFVLTFDAESGQVQSTTDCNSLSGSYVIEGEVLSIGQIATTKMFCEGSIESVYTEQLALTTSYLILGDTLHLNLNRDYGIMVFRRQ